VRGGNGKSYGVTEQEEIPAVGVEDKGLQSFGLL